MQVTLVDGTGLSVPDDMVNRHRRKVQAWIDAGNTPTPYVGPTALELWEQQMASSDSTLMPRWMEVHIEQEHGGVVADPTLQQKYNDKKTLRGQRP